MFKELFLSLILNLEWSKVLTLEIIFGDLLIDTSYSSVIIEDSCCCWWGSREFRMSTVLRGCLKTEERVVDAHLLLDELFIDWFIGFARSVSWAEVTKLSLVGFLILALEIVENFDHSMPPCPGNL